MTPLITAGGHIPQFSVAVMPWFRQYPTVTPDPRIPSDPSKGGGVAASRTTRPVIPDYELLRQIGQGSYGDVWLARGLTGVYRAIKIVWRDRFESAEPFEREFKGLKKFTSMSLPEAGQLALLHVGQNETAGFFYYVMELADDVETGREVNPAKYAPLTLKEVRQRRGRLPAAECVTYAVGLARALAGLHSRELVHRDIKPSNVILVGGVPKLADIGLVAETSDTLTYVGTEDFVPPEGPGKPAADVFALGKLLYELATGIDREDFPRLPPELDKVPDRKLLFELNEIILRCCEPVPEQRYRDATALLADLLRLQAGQSLRRSHGWRTVTAAAVIVALASGGLWWKTRHAAPAAVVVENTPPAVSDKSIAVLPFANMSADREGNTYFAEGIHDEILTTLGGIRELRVVSRTSVMQYQATKKPVREIARELGVAFLLEGSIRRAGNDVRVTAQLIDARADRQLWAKSYDRQVTHVFAIQGELAQAIAVELKAALTPAEAVGLGESPTVNPEAYDLFLQARAIQLREGATYSLSEMQKRQRLLEHAVEIDPRFARAWAELANVHASYVWVRSVPTEARLSRARTAIDTALRLAPDDRSVRSSFAYFHYLIRDYPRATQEFERLVRLYPNDALPIRRLGFIKRRLGFWTEALVDLQRSVALDPSDNEGVANLARHLFHMRRFNEAVPVYRRLAELRPEETDDRLLPAGFDTFPYLTGGDASAGDAYFARLPADQSNTPRMIERRKLWAWGKGNAGEFLRLDALQPTWADAEHANPSLQHAIAALVLLHTGDVAAARARVDPLIGQLRADAGSDTINLYDRIALAIAEIVLGNRSAAVTAAQKTVEAMPVSRDSIFGALARLWAARVYAWAGDKEMALAEVRRWLQTPPAPSVYLIRGDIGFAPLRGDPRFEALLADPANNAPITGNGPPAFTLR